MLSMCDFEKTSAVLWCRSSGKSEFATRLNWETSKCISSRPRPKSFYIPQFSMYCISRLPFFLFRLDPVFDILLYCVSRQRFFDFRGRSAVGFVCACYVFFREMSVFFIDVRAASGVLWNRFSRTSEFAKWLNWETSKCITSRPRLRSF